MSVIEYRNDGMDVYYEGRLLHSHYSNKVWTPAQVEGSVQRFIDAKMAQPQREKIIRQGGVAKAQMDAYFDSLVSAIKTELLAGAELHRKALSYERIIRRLAELDIMIDGLPLEVEETYLDNDGVEQTRMIDNPLREGYELGHIMLVGLPDYVEQTTYDNDGEVSGTEWVDNPAYLSANEEYTTLSAKADQLVLQAGVMAIVDKRDSAQGSGSLVP